MSEKKTVYNDVKISELQVLELNKNSILVIKDGNLSSDMIQSIKDNTKVDGLKIPILAFDSNDYTDTDIYTICKEKLLGQEEKELNSPSTVVEKRFKRVVKKINEEFGDSYATKNPDLVKFLMVEISQEIKQNI